MDKVKFIDMVAIAAESNEKQKADFLLAKSEDEMYLAKCELIKLAFRYCEGDGAYEVQTTCSKKVVCYVQKDGNSVPTMVIAQNGKCSSKAWKKEYVPTLAKLLPNEVIISSLSPISTEVPSNFKKYADGWEDIDTGNDKYWLAVRNAQRSFKDEFGEITEFPPTLTKDYDTYLNLEVVAGIILSLANKIEDGKGNKLVVKKSEIKANPLISDYVVQKIYQDLCAGEEDDEE